MYIKNSFFNYVNYLIYKYPHQQLALYINMLNQLYSLKKILQLHYKTIFTSFYIG